VLNYHLPELTRNTMDFKLLKEDISRTMSEVYTADELKWLYQFYSSPFGERMLKNSF